MRLLTVTPNVALDRTLTVPGWQKGSIARTDQTLTRAGGKGLNVARAADALGLAATAMAALGGPTGKHIEAVAEEEGLDAQWIWLEQGESRTCLILVDPDEPSATVINEVGPMLTADDWARLAALVRRTASQADVTAFCGSLPPGVSAAAFGTLLDDLMADGRALAVDISGEALAEALRRPLWLVKVNKQELGAAVGQDLSTPERAAAVARSIVSGGPRTVIVTLGAEGAVCARPDVVWWAEPPAIRSISPIGSGDSLLAGVIAGRLRGEEWPAPLILGVACGAADALTIGQGLIEPDEVTRLRERTTIRRLGIE